MTGSDGRKKQEPRSGEPVFRGPCDQKITIASLDGDADPMSALQLVDQFHSVLNRFLGGVLLPQIPCQTA